MPWTEEQKREYRAQHRDELVQLQREWVINNQEHVKKQRRDWYIKNKERQDARNRENYHMNKEKRLKQTAAYEKAHPEQRKRSARKYGLKRVGFNHTTNKPRGILCRHCNIGIGLLSENVETLASAIGYLERWK